MCLIHSLVPVEGIHGDSKVRGVNLGGWLVVEGWIKPSLFDGIPNGDMLVSFPLDFCCFQNFWRSSWFNAFLPCQLWILKCRMEQKCN